MFFNISCSRDIIGYRIEVEVKADGSDAIASVVTSFDNFEIGSDYLSPAEVQYQRVFRQIGGYTPGVERTVRVTASDENGKQKTASRTWQD